MRGTFINGTSKLQIEISGESWQQGQEVQVAWEQEGGPANATKYIIALALIDLRKMKKNEPKAIKIIEKVDLVEQKNLNGCTFNLEANASISDGTWTYSIVSGDLTDPLKLSRLDLTVTPWFIYNEVIKLIENFKRFKMKSIKNKKNKLDAKFSVPGGKEYGAIDALNIHFEKISSSSPDWPNILMQFHFKIKKLSYTGAAVETVKETFKVERELQKADYLSFGESINQDKLLSIFDEVFSEVSKSTRL